jgi:putative ABC transport system permease protein
MSHLLQLDAMLRMNVRTFPARVKPSLVIVFGVFAVVCVLLSALSLIEGIRIAYLRAGDPTQAIILRAGANYEAASSSIPAEWIPVIEQAPGIDTASDGSPLIDAQIYRPVSLTKNNGDSGYTSVRGIGFYGTRMIPHFKLLSGRTPRPGSNEMTVGLAAQQKFAHLKEGDSISLLKHNWVVVGTYSTGAFTEGDLLVSVETLRKDAPNHEYTSVLAMLKQRDHLAPLRAELVGHRKLPVTIQTSAAYWATRFDHLPSNAQIIDYFVSGLIALGVMVGTMHIMDAAMNSRAEEMAILRAIGFDGATIAAACVIEAVFLACLGAGLGTVIDWLWMDGYVYNGAYGVFRIVVTAHLLFIGIVWALGISLLGAILPSVRAVSTPVWDALGT